MRTGCSHGSTKPNDAAAVRAPAPRGLSGGRQGVTCATTIAVPCGRLRRYPARRMRFGERTTGLLAVGGDGADMSAQLGGVEAVDALATQRSAKSRSRVLKSSRRCIAVTIFYGEVECRAEAGERRGGRSPTRRPRSRSSWSQDAEREAERERMQIASAERGDLACSAPLVLVALSHHLGRDRGGVERHAVERVGLEPQSRSAPPRPAPLARRWAATVRLESPRRPRSCGDAVRPAISMPPFRPPGSGPVVGDREPAQERLDRVDDQQRLSVLPPCSSRAFACGP